MRLKRAWLVLNILGTKKLLILKRSKHSNNKGQWDFIGGSSRGKIKPRKLIRKESFEEIGLIIPKLGLLSIVKKNQSTYYYFKGSISKKDLSNIQLNYEHSKYEILDLIKLRKKKRLHHSIRVYLQTLNN